MLVAGTGSLDNKYNLIKRLFLSVAPGGVTLIASLQAFVSVSDSGLHDCMTADSSHACAKTSHSFFLVLYNTYI